MSVKQTLRRLDINPSTFYNWLKRFYADGVDGLEDKKPSPNTAWNKIPGEHYDAMLQLAMDKPDLSSRELAVDYRDEEDYFVSESTVYRLLKAHDLITSPAYILMSAADKFQNPTTRVNEIWQTYFKIIGWGLYYLSTILDDYLRYILAWRLCTSMGAKDVANTLDDVLSFTGLDQAKVKHKPRLLSDNAPRIWKITGWHTVSPTDTRQERTLASLDEKSDIVNQFFTYPVNCRNIFRSL